MKKVRLIMMMLLVAVLVTNCGKEDDPAPLTNNEQTDQTGSGTDDKEQDKGNENNGDQGSENNENKGGSDSGTTGKETIDVTSGLKGKVALYDQYSLLKTDHSGVTVKLTYQGKEYKGVSVKDGSFEVKSAPKGKYTITVSKPGYYCSTIGENINDIKLYAKATGSINDIRFSQTSKGIGFSATLKGITIPSSAKYLSIRFFVGSTSDVSKSKHGFEGNKTGVSTMCINVPVSEIKNNKIDQLVNSRLCGWRDRLQGTDTYMVCYITSTMGTFSIDDNYDDGGASNSGIGDTKSDYVYIR